MLSGSCNVDGKLKFVFSSFQTLYPLILSITMKKEIGLLSQYRWFKCDICETGREIVYTGCDWQNKMLRTKSTESLGSFLDSMKKMYRDIVLIL